MDIKLKKKTFIFKNKWFLFFKPMDLIIFSSFPLLGYFMQYKDFLPLSLISTALLLSLAINIDNRIEGYKINPMDFSENGLPFEISNSLLIFFKILRFILYSLTLLISLFFAPNSVPFIILSIFLAIIYNRNKFFQSKKHLIDLLIHLLGGWCFTVAGGSWKNPANFLVYVFAFSLSFWFAGGYLNHLLIDKIRDEKTGRPTLALYFKEKEIKIVSTLFLFFGDLLMVFLFIKKSIFLIISLSIATITNILTSFLIKDSKSFRIAYRLIHIFILIFILAFFILE